MNCFGASRARRNLNIKEPDYKALAKVTNFSKSELQEVYERFEDVANEVDGKITKEAFLLLPEVCLCPVAALVYDKEIARYNKDCLTFEDFVLVIDMFSQNMPVQNKTKCEC
jgi:Ca2+-binding EF-hand superfamily protein